VWVLEQTKAGVSHYHLVLWLPRGLTPPKPDKQGWWCHGLTRVEWARNPVAYLVKYASKAKAAEGFPPGARLFGVRGLGELTQCYRYEMRPFWLKDVTRQQDRVRRCRGGFVLVDSGEVLRSPFVMCARSSSWRWVEFCNRDDWDGEVWIVPDGKDVRAASSSASKGGGLVAAG
jgi:hypothetical protein